MSEYVQILPAFGTPGVCEDFDEDCIGLDDDMPDIPSGAVYAHCWAYDKERGQCPFVD